MITLTLVRHGESTDNLKGVWAGWKDAPLSNHGLNQAKAAGESFANFPITAIFASPLKRALTTAQQIQKHQTQSPLPPLTITPLIREQHFGEAEGHGWAPPLSSDTTEPTDPNTSSNDRGRLGILDSKTGKKSYPVQTGRTGKFPAGESLEDVSARVGEAFDEFVMPLLRDSKGKKLGDVNIVFVSHGIAISETIGAVFKRSVNGRGLNPRTWSGLQNTAWTRLVVGMEGESLDYSPDVFTMPIHEVAPEPPADEGEKMAGAVEAAGGAAATEESAAPKEITARVVAVNQHTHIDGLVRQKGGIGSMAHDEKQKAITDFFGGGGGNASKKAAEVPGKQKDEVAMDVDASSPSHL